MIIINFKEQVDKRAIFLLLGCYCNNPKLSLDEKYSTNANDYPENFHATLWGAIVNIAKKGNVQKVTPLDIENEVSQFQIANNLWQNNNGWEYIETAIDETKDKLDNVGQYFDDVRKYSIVRTASEDLKMDITWLYDENNEQVLSDFIKLTSQEVLNSINSKFLDFKELWKDAFSDNYSFHVGDDVEERLEEYRNQDNTYGYPFQSAYMTTIFRGMRKKKFIIRSSISGGGKSRNSMAEAANIACSKMYDWYSHSWVSTGDREPALFISTELEKEEIQDCLLAHISGIEQDRIEEWKEITPEEELVLQESAIEMKDSLLFGEYLPDFTIDSINSKIEQYVINHQIGYAFFDYINDSPDLYSYYYEKTKTRLRTDQILFLFSTALKRSANKFNIYLGSSTQLNDTYKDDANKDAGALKGSKAIIEKADGGILALPVTKKDLKKLDPILNSEGSFGQRIPNMAYYVFKNRGGKWKAIIVWTQINLGTMREIDCFVTDYNFELITDIEKTIQDFELHDVGDVQVMEDEEINISGEELATELARKS